MSNVIPLGFSYKFLFQGGVIGGVQNAINSAMDTIKFVLVIVLPQTETFGQAHHMFSRFLNLRTYEYFSRNFIYFFLQYRSFLFR